jgi:hypothetical protein
MNVETMMKHLSAVPPQSEITLESPAELGKCYPIETMYLAEGDAGRFIALKSSEDLKAPCHRCESGKSIGTQIYQLDYFAGEPDDQSHPRRVILNVTSAYAFAKKCMQPVVIPRQDAEHLVLINISETFCGAHVDHVDRSVPPMIGMLGGKLILMDGTHRMMSQIKNLLPPWAYVLNERQTMEFVIADTPREVER